MNWNCLRQHRPPGRQLIKRAEVVAPEVLVDPVSDDFYKKARFALDIIWQSFGIRRCWLYDEHGQWARRREADN